MRGELSQFIDEMIVSESMIDHILETRVTEREFLEQLQELNQKINFVKEQSFKETRSVHDVEGVVEKLKFKVTMRILFERSISPLYQSCRKAMLLH